MGHGAMRSAFHAVLCLPWHDWIFVAGSNSVCGLLVERHPAHPELALSAKSTSV
jgi:hypothetical protein